MNIVITGGAGFIGSALAEKLLQNGNKVTIVDNFSPQIHLFRDTKRKQLIDDGFHVIEADISVNHQWIEEINEDIDAFVHLAAETGTGQSMYEILKYSQSNIQATASILDAIRKDKLKVSKFLVASSRSIYGEGKAFCTNHGHVYPPSRKAIDLDRGLFELKCPICQSFVKSVATDENSLLVPESVYAITKLTQEQLIIKCCQAMNITAVALRLQNVFGPGQSLTNPYTGILSIFSARLRENLDINIFEDGLESRDFVYIDDVVNAFNSAIHASLTSCQALNIGSGVPTTVIDIAKNLKTLFNASSNLNITGNYRIGDIRHNFADINQSEAVLGYKPRYSLDQGLKLFADWVVQQEISELHYEQSLAELRKYNMLK
jgi:dTDP-L-rhamnose 4-epimerase